MLLQQWVSVGQLLVCQLRVPCTGLFFAQKHTSKPIFLMYADTYVLACVCKGACIGMYVCSHVCSCNLPTCTRWLIFCVYVYHHLPSPRPDLRSCSLALSAWTWMRRTVNPKPFAALVSEMMLNRGVRNTCGRFQHLCSSLGAFSTRLESHGHPFGQSSSGTSGNSSCCNCPSSNSGEQPVQRKVYKQV